MTTDADVPMTLIPVPLSTAYRLEQIAKNNGIEVYTLLAALTGLAILSAGDKTYNGLMNIVIEVAKVRTNSNYYVEQFGDLI